MSVSSVSEIGNGQFNQYKTYNQVPTTDEDDVDTIPPPSYGIILPKDIGISRRYIKKLKNRRFTLKNPKPLQRNTTTDNPKTPKTKPLHSWVSTNGLNGSVIDVKQVGVDVPDQSVTPEIPYDETSFAIPVDDQKTLLIPYSKPQNPRLPEENSITDENSGKHILIASHQNRILCLLSSFGIISGKKIRFKNCAIVSLSFERITNEIRVTTTLVYEGEIDPDEGTDNIYYSASAPITDKTHFQDKSKTYKLREFKQIFHLLPTDIYDNEPVTFYLMRHGQGFHNTKEGRKKLNKIGNAYKDALLTEIGIHQTKAAANEFNNIMIETKIQGFNWVFASDLRRTSETATIFLENLSIPAERLNRDIIVLPCSHEIAYNNGVCDRPNLIRDPANIRSCGNWSGYKYLATCQTRSIETNESPVNVRIYWPFYDLFYSDKRRGIVTSRLLRATFDCNNTNMIALAVFFMNIYVGAIDKKYELKKFIDERNKFSVPIVENSQTYQPIQRSGPQFASRGRSWKQFLTMNLNPRGEEKRRFSRYDKRQNGTVIGGKTQKIRHNKRKNNKTRK